MAISTIVLGVIGEDCHAVGNKILEVAFKESDFNVVNLGVQVSQEEFIEAALTEKAEAIVVSSLYGHAELDTRGFLRKVQNSQLNDIILYIGGNLSLENKSWKEIELKFKQLGFYRVFNPAVDLKIAINQISQDILFKRALEQNDLGIVNENIQ